MPRSSPVNLRVKGITSLAGLQESPIFISQKLEARPSFLRLSSSLITGQGSYDTPAISFSAPTANIPTCFVRSTSSLFAQIGEGKGSEDDRALFDPPLLILQQSPDLTELDYTLNLILLPTGSSPLSPVLLLLVPRSLFSSNDLTTSNDPSPPSLSSSTSFFPAIDKHLDLTLTTRWSLEPTPFFPCLP